MQYSKFAHPVIRWISILLFCTMSLALVVEARVVPSNTIKKELSEEGETEQCDEDAVKNKLAHGFIHLSKLSTSSEFIAIHECRRQSHLLPYTFLEADKRPPRV